METIDLGAIICRVKRSSRRTVAIRVTEDGYAEILAPHRVTLAELRRIAEPYTERLAQDCAKMRERTKERETFTLQFGDRLRLLGGERELRIGKPGRIRYDDEAFYLPEDCDLRLNVIELYKLAAKNYIPARVMQHAARMGLHVASVKINSAKTHWASCSARNTLNFAWYTIMATPEQVDYVIIHELCHMWEFNHSARFWQLVEQFCPEYKTHRAALRELGLVIAKENWK